MANYATLKAAINQYITTNGNNEITGAILNNILDAMVDSLGANYGLGGVATPSTNPGTPDQNVFYLAFEAGTYTNFNNTVLPAGVSTLMWNGAWTAQTWYTIDAKPTYNSNNFVKSGGVYEELALGAVYDVTAHNSGATFASLSALLSNANLNTLIPTSVRKGGMSIKFVQSSDNKYVQFRLMKNTWSTTVSDWQGVDDKPTDGSKNLVESGGVDAGLTEIRGFSDIFIFGNIKPLEKKKYINKDNGSIAIYNNAYLSNLIDVHQYQEIYIVSPVNMENVWGWRILASDGETILSYGSTTSEKVLKVVLTENSYYFQFSQRWDIYNQCVLQAKTKQSVASLERQVQDIRGFSDIYVFDNYAPLETSKYINTENGNLSNFANCYLSNLIDVHQYKKIRVASSVNMEVVWGWRVFASDGETMLFYGACPADKTLDILLTDDSYYFQFSQLKSIYKYCSLQAFSRQNIGTLEEKVNECVNGIKENEENIKTMLNFNIFNPATDLLDGKQYINPDNGTISVTGWGIYTTKPLLLSNLSDDIPDHLYLINAADPNDNVGYRFLDSSDNVIAYGTNNSKNCVQKIEIPTDAHKFQVSIHTEKLLSAIIGGIIPNEKDVRILKEDVRLLKTIPYAPENTNGAVTIAANETAELINDGIVNREWVTSCNIELNGEMDGNIEILVGVAAYGISKITITPTKVIETYMPTQTCTAEYEHGLTLTNSFSVMIKFDIFPKIKLMSGDGIFDHELMYFDGTDGMQIKNATSHSIVVQNANIDRTMGLVRKVLVFGDSYVHEKWGIVHSKDFNYSWTTILKEFGAYFSNVGYPGGTSVSMLRNYINMGSLPNIIIYGVGMNNGADTDEDTPNHLWLNELNSAVSIAESVGAILIPCTIPSIPSKSHAGKSKYIRTNFTRYIDFDYILTGISSTWKTGYFASDGIHPTALGFEAMATQAVKDVPELFNK